MVEECPGSTRLRLGSLCPVGFFLGTSCGCNDEDSVRMECFRNSNHPAPGTNDSYGICGCNTFWGFTGDTCYEEGKLSNVMTYVASVVLVLQVTLLFHCIYVARKSVNSLAELKAWSAKTSTCCLIVCSAMGQVLWNIGMVLTFTRSINVEIWEKRVKIAAPTLTASCFLLGALNISVMWIELARRTKKMKRARSNIRRYRIVVNLLGLACATVIIIFSALRKTQISAIVTIFIFFVLSATFMIGSRRLEHLVRNTALKTRGRVAIQWARKTSYRFSIASFFYVLIAGTYAFGTQKQNGWLMNISMQLLLVTVAILSYIVMWYIRQTMTRVGKRELARGMSRSGKGLGISKTSSKFLSRFGKSKPKNTSAATSTHIVSTPPRSVGAPATGDSGGEGENIERIAPPKVSVIELTSLPRPPPSVERV